MLTGVACKIVSAFCFTAMAALIRWVGNDIPAGEVVFARSAFALVPILLWLGLRGQVRAAVQTDRVGGHLLRSTVGALAMFCMFAGLARLPLPNATMLSYAAPIITLLLAATLLGEELRAARLGAVLLGLAGVAVMLGPHMTGFVAAEPGGLSSHSVGTLLALGGAFFTACAMIQIRRLVQTESTGSIVVYFSVFSTLFALATLPFGWVVPDLSTGTVLFLIGTLGGVGQVFLTSAYQHAEASVIAPFEYTTLLWALTIGWFAFGDLPDTAAFVGGAVVVVSGLIVISDERRRGNRDDAAAEAEPPLS